MRNGYQEEYRGYILKRENDYLVIYDQYNNLLKKQILFNKGTKTDCKHYIDKIIKKGW